MALFHFSKLKRIGLLMCASGLLLSLFIGRWLQSEYNTAKMELQKDLFDQFMSARSRMADSLIAKNLIDPILHDPNGFKIRNIDETILSKSDSVRIIRSEVNLYSFQVGLDTKNRLPGSGTEIEMRFETDSTDLLYQGVKLFISKVRGPEGEVDVFEKFIMPDDTSLIKTFYAENLEQNGLHVQPVWVNNRQITEFPPPLFYFETHFFETPFGVQIEQTRGYLWRSITPQLLFALLLFSAIIAAFIFSYRSLSGQIKLATLKDDLVSNISHELKTPVATVKVALEAMQEMDPVEKKDKLKNYLGMATQEINRLEMLVNKVMNSVLQDHGKQVFQKEPVYLGQLIAETIESMQAQIQQKNATVTFKNNLFIDEIMADPFHMKNVIFNLLDNSLKYGGEHPEIVIQLENNLDQVVLTCSDNGPGIPPAYISKIFEKFFRVPSGNDHTIKGYGLGLYYAAQVIAAAGGSIEVKNNPDQGCTFILKFPIPQ